MEICTRIKFMEQVHIESFLLAGLRRNPASLKIPPSKGVSAINRIVLLPLYYAEQGNYKFIFFINLLTK